MGNERRDDATDRRRADVYSSARIGAAAALTIVLGVTDYSFALTTHAKAHGWDAAFGAGVVSSSIGQSGRGERARTSGTRQIRGCAVSMGGDQGQVDVSRTA